METLRNHAMSERTSLLRVDQNGEELALCVGLWDTELFECPDRVETDKDGKKKSLRKSVTFESERTSKKKKSATDWNRFTRREERDTDDDEDFNELHMRMHVNVTVQRSCITW